MPSLKTEGTELSFGFGILGIEDFLELDSIQLDEYFSSTLSHEKYRRFVQTFSKNEQLYRKMYTVGFGVRAVYKHFNSVKSLHWTGPKQQASTISAAKDLIVANVPVSVKANSNVVQNASPYNLFEALPEGKVFASKSDNWYLLMTPSEYQFLYDFIRNNIEESHYLPSDVTLFEQSFKRKDRKLIKDRIKNLSLTKKEEFDRLYLQMCHEVAKRSATVFNEKLKLSVQSRSRKAVLEQLARFFFRLDSVEYVLGGIDRGKAFAVVIPDLSNWNRNWTITQVVAEPELERKQSRVRFYVTVKAKNGDTYTAEFHAEIRWSHGKFQGNPEAKLYKDFVWEELPFFESIYGLERYVRLRLIGEGAFGTVYEALHRPTATRVAVKEFKRTVVTSREERLRFQREIKLLSKLKHPNILPVIDFDASPRGHMWYAMPLAEKTIADIVDELKSDFTRVDELYLQILSGMAYAHAQKVIHRDLKPQNIMLFPEDVVMIGDFGFGKYIGDAISSVALTNTDENLGTFAYMAPEQFSSAANVDFRADIYSLGKTLLHMIVGGEPPMFPKRILHKADKRYVPFIERCLEEDPQDRFQSVNDMMTAFLEIMKGCDY